jgi:hypothetical protein
MCSRSYVSVLTVFSEIIREAANSMPEDRGIPFLEMSQLTTRKRRNKSENRMPNKVDMKRRSGMAATNCSKSIPVRPCFNRNPGPITLGTTNFFHHGFHYWY